MFRAIEDTVEKAFVVKGGVDDPKSTASVRVIEDKVAMLLLKIIVGPVI